MIFQTSVSSSVTKAFSYELGSGNCLRFKPRDNIHPLASNHRRPGNEQEEVLFEEVPTYPPVPTVPTREVRGRTQAGSSGNRATSSH